MKCVLILLLLFTSCTTKHVELSPADTKVSCSMTDQQIEDLITQDIENKKWQRVYLNEIDAAVRHEDWNSVGFFVNEYMDIPSEIVPLWLRHHPRYVEPVSQLEKHFRITIFLPAE